jgi:hypothetical protein
MNTHRKPFECDICKKGIRSERGVLQHLADAHINCCGGCGLYKLWGRIPRLNTEFCKQCYLRVKREFGTVMGVVFHYELVLPPDMKEMLLTYIAFPR